MKVAPRALALVLRSAYSGTLAGQRAFLLDKTEAEAKEIFFWLALFASEAGK